MSDAGTPKDSVVLAARATEILREEHRILELALSGLRGLAAALEARLDCDDAPNRFVEFLDEFAVAFHHAREERFALEALGTVGVPRDRGPVAELLDEREFTRHLLTTMRRASAEMERGRGSGAERYAAAARWYADLMRDHIDRTDNGVFRMIDVMLDSEARLALAQTLDSSEAREARDSFDRTAKELARRWSGTSPPSPAGPRNFRHRFRPKP